MQFLCFLPPWSSVKKEKSIICTTSYYYDSRRWHLPDALTQHVLNRHEKGSYWPHALFCLCVFFHRGAAITGAKSCLSGVLAERQGHIFLQEGLPHDQWSPTEVSEPHSWTTATDFCVFCVFARKLHFENFTRIAQRLNVVVEIKYCKHLSLKPFRNG